MRDRMKILLAYDGSTCADAALDDLGRAGLPEDMQLTVLTVPENWLPLPVNAELLDGVDVPLEFKLLTQRAAARLSGLNPGWEIKQEVLVGSPATLIIEKSKGWNVDLIVLGPHGRTALGRFFFGSVSQKVLHEAHCSVRIARGRLDEPGTPVRLIIGVDGSKSAKAAVQAVLSRNWPAGTEVRLVNGIWKLPPAAADHMLQPIADWIARENVKVKVALKAAFARLQLAGLNPSIVVNDEEPKRLLCSEAESWGADCIFLGSTGVSGIERFLLGSVSSGVAARAHCSVEVVREQ